MKTKNLIKAAFLCLLVGIGLISYRNEITGLTTLEQRVVHEDYKYLGVNFCETDDCNQVIADFIKSDMPTPDCAFYDIDSNKIIDSLKEKPYRLVTDEHSKVWIAHRTDDNKRLTHNKFCVDNGTIITGTFNPKENSVFKDYNTLLTIKSDYLAINYQDEFNELWSGDFGSGNKVKYPIIYYGDIRIENYFCPEDNCKEKLLYVLDKADKSINFMWFSMTDKDVGEEVVQENNSGVKVMGVVEKQRINMQYELYKYLKENGIDVVPDSSKYTMHEKTVIVDDYIVVTGSYNPTGAGNTKNDENMLIIYDKNLASIMNARFYRIHNESKTQGI